MKTAVLTSPNQWFEKYAYRLSKDLKCALYFDHVNVKDYDIVFILSYHKIIPDEILKTNKHNIVIHESDLPEGKGWAPMFWQILEGKNKIVFSMFEASEGIDNGDIYTKKVLYLNGKELHYELREKQALLTIEMCKEFINNYEKYKNPMPQNGKEFYYPKREPKDSELDINKTIKEQFNLLRIVNNDEYPAFFYIDSQKYIIKIEKDNNQNKKN